MRTQNVCGFAILFLIVSSFPTLHSSAQELLFADDFDGPNIDSAWMEITSGALDIFDGRLRSLDNGRVLNSVDELFGGIQIEVDIEKLGNRNHTGWDLAIGVIDRKRNGEKAIGTLRFDHDGIDAIGTGSDTNVINDLILPPSVPADSPNSGHAVFTYEDSRVNFSFTNTAGETLIAEESVVELSDSYQLFVNLAAFDDSPRYLDNLRVHAIPVPEPSGLTLGILGMLWLLRHRKTKC